MNQKHIFERVILLIISIGALCFVGVTVYPQFKTTKQRMLFYQLQTLRMGVNIYQFVNHKNPESLQEIIVKNYKMPNEPVERPFIAGFVADSVGHVFDPFGNPYKYDSKTGWVKSVTRGCELW